jgi:hypothetical protein
LREFSAKLDKCTEDAWKEAIEKLLDRDKEAWYQLPILPLVLGGDDLTFICKGHFALQFTRDYLKAFEENTGKESIIKQISHEALGIPKLSACAGIAIIKPHFPFHAGYELAEQLIKSAKTVKSLAVLQTSKNKQWACSALDFHILYDSSDAELSRIRQMLHQDDKQTRLHCRPYIITDQNQFTEAANHAWAKLHHWLHLERSVQALKARDQDQRLCLPNSQMHDLRESLFLGRTAAENRFKLIYKRYQAKGLNNLLGDSKNESLFVDSLEKTSNGETIYLTRLLDAIDATEFLTLDESQC